MSFEQSFQNLLGWEGGYGNNAKDPGGPTNLGVIQSEYDTYRASKRLPVQSVKHITLAEAEDIYKNEYWDATLCDQLNPGLANCLFDADVNSGDRRGVTWLQEAINQVSEGKITIDVDGKAGLHTMTAAASLPVDALIDAMLTLRLAFMHVAKNPKTGALLWPTFGRGWAARINGVRSQSHALAGLTVPQTILVQPPKEEPSMATASAPLPIATAGVNVSTTTVGTTFASVLTSFAVAVGGPIFSLIQGTTTSHYVAAGLFALAGAGSLISNIWGFVNHNSAASSNTLATINNLTQLAAQAANSIEPQTTS